MKCLRGKQKGFTLIELLVVIPIIGIVGIGAGMIIIQLLQAKSISNDTLAVRQVQLAGDWVSRDGIQSPASDITIATTMTDNTGFLRTTYYGFWVDNATSYLHSTTTQITYKLVASGSLWQLTRRQVTTEIIRSDAGVPQTSPPVMDSTITLGSYLDASQMTCTWDTTDNISFTFRAVATVGSETESRDYRIQPRMA